MFPRTPISPLNIPIKIATRETIIDIINTFISLDRSVLTTHAPPGDDAFIKTMKAKDISGINKNIRKN